MQTITETKSADLMAQWLATGGATDAAGREETAGDDGLTACEPSFSRMCFIDDGLTATGPTQSYHNCQRVDDGLAASRPSSYRGCAEDDGLAATGFPTSAKTGCMADDGLSAGGYTITFCPVMAPEQAPAR
jgi:hypothetical protein